MHFQDHNTATYVYPKVLWQFQNWSKGWERPGMNTVAGGDCSVFKLLRILRHTPTFALPWARPFWNLPSQHCKEIKGDFLQKGSLQQVFLQKSEWSALFTEPNSTNFIESLGQVLITQEHLTLPRALTLSAAFLALLGKVLKTSFLRCQRTQSLDPILSGTCLHARTALLFIYYMYLYIQGIKALWVYNTIGTWC